MAARLAAALALCGLGGLFWLAGHRSWSGGRLLPAEARANTGDEPHYLLIVNSILRDHDLQLEDDYWRAWRGGAEAGLAARGRRIDHHTLLVDHADGRAVFWHEAYDWSRPVECGGSRCAGFALRLPEFAPGPGIVEVSSHPIAYPALLAALLAPLRDSPEQVELHAVALSALFGWLACIASYLVARRSGMERRWAVCAALLAGAASPLLAYGRALFPEALLAMVLSLGLLAMQSGRPVLAGLACAAALALKPPFAVVAAGFCGERLLARRPRTALAIALVAGTAAAAVVALNLSIARTPLIAGTEPWRWATSAAPLFETLAGEGHGLFRFAPWTLLAVLAFARGAPRLAPPPDAAHVLVRQIALPLMLYLCVIALRANDSGTCWGPRYWVAFLPWLALLAVQVARWEGRTFAVALLLLGALSAPIAIAGALRYPEVFGAGPLQTLSLR